jgi:hypothetical protein
VYYRKIYTWQYVIVEAQANQNWGRAYICETEQRLSGELIQAKAIALVEESR